MLLSAPMPTRGLRIPAVPRALDLCPLQLTRAGSNAVRRCQPIRFLRHVSIAAAPASASIAPVADQTTAGTCTAVTAVTAGRPEWLETVYTSQQALPRFIGSVAITSEPGKGRGTVATAALAAGDLIMVTPPLAIVRSLTSRPDSDALVDFIIEKGLHTSRWFDVLYDGSARSVAQVPILAAKPSTHSASPFATSTIRTTVGLFGLPEPVLSLPAQTPAKPATKLPPKIEMPGRVKLSKGFGRPGSMVTPNALVAPAAISVPSQPPAPLDSQTARQIAKVCSKNCFGDEIEDAALTACRGGGGAAHIGLWPEFSFLNHSCTPNAINYVLDSTMIVRIVKPVAAGEEVTISYLGRPQLAPLAIRRAVLQEDYGFECMCERCIAEEMNEDKVQPIMDDLHYLVTGDSNTLAKRVQAARQRMRRCEAAVKTAVAGVSCSTSAGNGDPSGAESTLREIPTGLSSSSTGNNGNHHAQVARVADHDSGAATNSSHGRAAGIDPTVGQALALRQLTEARVELKAAAEEAHDAVQAGVQQLYAAFRRTVVSPTVRLYICASLYDAFELLMDCQQALDKDCSTTLANFLKAVSAVTAGSDLQVILASRQLVAAEAAALALSAENDSSSSGHLKLERAKAAVAVARATAVNAHVARYGVVGDELLQRLINYNATLYD